MAFEFPASPTTGQVSNGFQWDGEKWKGGQPSGPQKETFVDYAGKSTVDVAVPTWAKSCRITASVTPTATGQFLIRTSMDGTTFLAGASDYTVTAPWHYSSPPTYTTLAQQALSALPLTLSSDVLTVAHTMTAEISLVRPSTGDVFSYKSQGTSFNAAGQLTTVWHQGFVNVAPSGSALTIKALRFLGLIGKPGSSIHIQWLGDDAQVPISNAIADAPSDGNEYTRVNGVWRLSKQTFVMGTNWNNGTGNIFTPPTGAKAAIVKASLWSPSSNQIMMRWSADGTTFPAGATDYSVGGWVHFSGSAAPGFMIIPLTNGTSLGLTQTTDNVSIPVLIELMQIVSKTAGGAYTAKWSSAVYNSAAAQNLVQVNYTGYTNSGVLNAATSLKFQIYPNNVALTAGSWATVEWLY